jgi:cytochrome c oxidase subunit 3
LADSRTSPVPFQYATPEQRRAADLLGMWVFLATEILLFGSLFAAFAVYAALYPSVFREASRYLNLSLGAVNTVVLLLSSLAMALAIRGAQVGSRRALTWLLATTAGLGLLFLGIKAVEYTEHVQNHLAPGFGFAYPGADPKHAELFFLLYFIMTGLHALHLSVGVLLVATMLLLARQGHFSPARYEPVNLTGLYWHFVDVIWVFLFPVLYLVGRH